MDGAAAQGKSLRIKIFFCILDEIVSALKAQLVDVGFWWIPREVRAAPLQIFVLAFVSLIKGPTNSPKMPV